MNELDFLEPLINSFEKLPGVGKKTATRYAFYVTEKFNEEDIAQFILALSENKEKIHHCKKCHMLTTKDICSICSDLLRDKTKILVVKDTKDIISIERTKQYNGLYHVLGGLISPLDGIGPDDINLDSLEKRMSDKEVKEIILATPLSPSGETTALYIEKVFSRDGLTISRIGYGIPAGGDIEYADELTLKKALEFRNKI